MKQEVKIGQADYTVLVLFRDSTTGLAKTGLTGASAGMNAAYTRVETDNDVTIAEHATLHALATPALTDVHLDWGFIEVDAVHAPGLYRLDIPDGAFATGAWSAVVSLVCTGCDTVHLEFVLVPEAPYTGVNTSMWNATAVHAPATAGVPYVDVHNWLGAAAPAMTGDPFLDSSGVTELLTRVPDATAGQAGGLFIAGSNAATTFATLTVTGALTVSDGIAVTCSTGNKTGVAFTGNGTGNGMTITSGNGITGTGVAITANSTNGSGMLITGVGSGEGISTAGGTTGNGIYAVGGGTSGHGIYAFGSYNGAGIKATGTLANPGMNLLGGPTGPGLLATGGSNDAAADGIRAVAGGALASDIDAHAPDIVDGVWDEVLHTDHEVASSASVLLQAAGGAADPWLTALPGAYGAGTAGRIMGRSLPDVTAGGAGGLMIAGSNAATTFATLTVTGATTLTGLLDINAGVDIDQTTVNGEGLSITGNGTGAGVNITGGNTGPGLYASAAAESAMKLEGVGADNAGLEIIGTGAGSYGLRAAGVVAGIYGAGTAAAGIGMSLLGNTSGVGLKALGGNDSPGATVTAGGGNNNGITIVGTGSGHGLAAAGAGGGTGHGISATSGSGATGDGINATSTAVAGNGLKLTGTTTGEGLNTNSIENSGTFVQTGNLLLSDGITVAAPSTGNRAGVAVTGNGTGQGIIVTGGGTSASGVAVVGGAPNGIAIYAQGDGSGEGVRIDGGDGSGSGVEINGGATNGSGVTITGDGTGHGLAITSGDGATGNGVNVTAASTNGFGVSITGVGSGDGLSAAGGLTGNGIKGTGGGTSGDGIYAKAAGTGNGLSCHGGGVAGDGINAIADNDGDGIEATGATNGHGMLLTGLGTGEGLSATGGATGAGMLVKGGGNNANADGLRAEAGGALALDIDSAVLSATLADTNELQTDWTNAGRLDAILDIIAADTTTDIPATITTMQGNITTIMADTDLLDDVAGGLADIHTDVAAVKVDTAAIKAITDNLPSGIKKNTALTNFEFYMVLAVDHISPALLVVVDCQRSIDGAAFANCNTAVATEVSAGVYKLDLAASDLNGNVITFKMSEATCDTRIITIKTST